MDREVYDAVVIGSGAGGGPCAYGLAIKGKKVLLLEAGPRYDPYEDYHLHKNDWEIQRFPDREKGKYTFGKGQSLKEDLSHLRSRNKAHGLLNHSSFRKYVEYYNAKGVGGSTLKYQGEAHRFHPRAFKIKDIYGVGNDWPITYEDLAPYYETAEHIIGVAGPKVNPYHPRKNALPLPPHKLSYASQIVEKACSEMGLRLIPNTVAILSRAYDGRPNCNYCCGCSFGCPRKDKGSVDVTFIPKAEATGKCKIIEGAHVFRITVKKAKVNGVLYYDSEGKEKAVSSKVVVVSCGAVETPRLLLNSEIANNSGQIGKNFMETLLWLSTALYSKRLDSYRGIPIDGEILNYLFPETEFPFVSGFRLFTTAGLAPGPLSFALSYVKGWGKEFKRKVERDFGHTLSVGGIGEFLPNKDTYISIDTKEKDRFGVPVAKIQAFLGENEIRLLNFMSAKCRDILKLSGTDEIIDDISSYDMFLATHVFGTCMMGKDPETSVVNPFCQSHDIPNLFIADGSVFPSSGGGSSPSLTISAIGLRVADYITKKGLA